MYLVILILKKGYKLRKIIYKNIKYIINYRKDSVLPGSKHPNYMKRNIKLTIELISFIICFIIKFCYRVKGVKFSPNGQSWGAATTEGVSIFSSNETQYFNPYELNENISKDLVLINFQKGDYFNSLIVIFDLFFL